MRQRFAFLTGLLNIAGGIVLMIIAVIYKILTPKLKGNYINAKFLNTFIRIDQYTTRSRLLLLSGALLIVAGLIILLFMKLLKNNVGNIVAIVLTVLSVSGVFIIFFTRQAFGYRDYYMLTEEYRIMDVESISEEAHSDVKITFSSGMTSLFTFEDSRIFYDNGTWGLFMTPTERNKRWYVIHGPYHSVAFSSLEYSVNRYYLDVELK